MISSAAVTPFFSPLSLPAAAHVRDAATPEGSSFQPVTAAEKLSQTQAFQAQELHSSGDKNVHLNKTDTPLLYGGDGRLSSAAAKGEPLERESNNSIGSVDEGQAKQTLKSKEELQSEAEKQEVVRELAARDREVRTHEQAHASAGGAYAGAPKYQFERGPDGVNYAVGGEVPIDVGAAATPEQTIAKAQTIRRAALAPAEPSPQDRQVAQESIRLEAAARQELQIEIRADQDEVLTSRAQAKESEDVSTEAVIKVEPDSNLALDPQQGINSRGVSTYMHVNAEIGLSSQPVFNVMA